MLELIYLKKLAGMLAAEKKYTACFKKLSGAAFTDELRRAFSPESSDQHMHAQRLRLCLKLSKSVEKGVLSVLDRCVLDHTSQVARGKVLSLRKDLEILHTGQEIIQRKIQVYAALQQMAAALGRAQAAELLAQCFKDEQNASNYLLQISQNIIYPLAAGAEG
jgi:ferritin-like metal-binding protein YciE